MKCPIIALKNVKKVYDNDVIIENLNLSIRRNEFMTILGPSGCGKTTTLRMIGGFEEPTSGEILFNGENINDVPPYKRQINTVFQKYSLFTHMNIFENIAFGLKIKKIPKNEIKDRVNKMLKLVNLEGYENRSVESLSGGQQQRIAIARALVNEPEILLLDEPLGALDLKLRKEMQVELKKMQQKLGITFIYVTHDQEEALTMSDTIVVMNDGKIQQMGTAEAIYNEPENHFVAKFIGESNIIDGIMLSDYKVFFANKEFECVDKGFETNENIEVVIRPEDFIVSSSEGMWKAKIISKSFKGVHYEIIADDGENQWMIHTTNNYDKGMSIGLSIEPDNIHIMKR
ncbi:MAG: ABC transporter ATP-binding protein [Tissierellales bacterium]|jgi:spermidine/putrescine transport system ATP-binding protein|nr:ABC transporter ATP-binding protein [Tissierellales bacterium]